MNNKLSEEERKAKIIANFKESIRLEHSAFIIFWVFLGTLFYYLCSQFYKWYIIYPFESFENRRKMFQEYVEQCEKAERAYEEWWNEQQRLKKEREAASRAMVQIYFMRRGYCLR
jgi:hypothetical protein